MTKRLKIVAFTGPKYSGKDTAAQALLSLGEDNFRHRMMAGPAKDIAARAFGYPPEWNNNPLLKEVPLEEWPYICPRQLVIDVANWYRSKYGGSVWARAFERDCLQDKDPPLCWVQTDLRFPEELEMLRRHQALIIYIQRDEAEQALRGAQKAGDQMANNVSESHYALLRNVANAEVDNNGTVGHLHGQVQAIVQNAWGHWKFWDTDIKRSA